MKRSITKITIIFMLAMGLLACTSEGEEPEEEIIPTGPVDPADTYFSLAVTENSHNHTGARLLFLDFQGEIANAAVIQNNIVISPKVANGAITLDGSGADWDSRLFSTINGLVQNNYPLSEFIDAVATDITVGSAWDDDYLYIIVQWQDAGHTQSTKYKKWKFDGLDWNPLVNVGTTTGAPNDNVANASHVLSGAESEDRVFMMFPISDGENNFQDGGLGCAAYCHANLVNDNPAQNYTGTGVAVMHTNISGDRADIWHWKSARTAPRGVADDKYIAFASGSNNGRMPDSGTAAYSNNGSGSPEFMHNSGLGFTNDTLLIEESVALSGAPVMGQELPATVSIVPTGSRADVQASSSYDIATNRWTVEFKRLRNTGNSDDRQFNGGLNVLAPLAPVIESGNAAGGAILYARECASCHGQEGEGVLSGNSWDRPRVQRASGSSIRQAIQRVASMQGKLALGEQGIEDIAAHLQTLAIFVPTYPLTVNVTNAPAGSQSLVTSDPIGIDCVGGGTFSCGHGFLSDTTITLTATSITGYTFDWSGVTCSEGLQTSSNCTITLIGAQTVTLNYTVSAVVYTLTVNNGANGTVTSSPQGQNPVGINCAAGTTCTTQFTENAQVTLNPTPDTGYQLSAWTGDCTGNGACVLTMNNNKTVTVAYELIPSSGQVCSITGTPPAIPDINRQTVVSGFSNPVHVTNAGDGSGRLFVVEQSGTIRVVQGGALVAGDFLDIRDRVNTSANEMGLLSIAFHPNYSSNGKFYVNYTSGSGETNPKCSSSRCTIISEFTEGATATLEDSERIMLDIVQPNGNHNGGQLAFDANGYLYIGMGDGGGSGDPLGNGQDLTTLLGSILRIDVDNKDTGLEYAIPADNPLWLGVTGARREIWAYGLRNPWRFSFDPFNDDLYAGDVGQGAREEIDIVTKGANYGWNEVEGDICYTSGCNLSAFTPPLTVRSHNGDGWYSITGGVVYRGSNIPNLCGTYLYGDYVAGAVRGLRYDGAGGILEDRSLASISNLSSFGYDENYEVYALNRGSGILYKFIP